MYTHLLVKINLHINWKVLYKQMGLLPISTCFKLVILFQTCDIRIISILKKGIISNASFPFAIAPNLTLKVFDKYYWLIN